MNFKKTIITTISSALIFNFAFAQENTPEQRGMIRVSGQAEMRPVNASNTKFLQERKEDRMEFRQNVEEIKDDYKMMASSSTSTKTPIREMRREIKMEVQNFKQERKEGKDNFVQEKVLDNATATAKIASKLNITPEQLKAQLSATNTDLKTLLKNASLTKEEVRQILPPVVKERIATTSEKFVPRILQNIFGPRKEFVTETVSVDGNVEVKVESRNGFFRNLFGF